MIKMLEGNKYLTIGFVEIEKGTFVKMDIETFLQVMDYVKSLKKMEFDTIEVGIDGSIFVIKIPNTNFGLGMAPKE